MNKPNPLNQVFQRRWAVPILAFLAHEGGCKFVTLANNLDGSRESLKASLDLLDTLGLVKPNHGYGHPMRPEYVLTDRGSLVSKPSAALIRTLDHANAMELGLKKWSMPVIYTVGSGSDRFGMIAGALRSATDRAVSLSLTELQAVSLIQRVIVDDRPPRNAYTLTRRGQCLSPVLADIQHAMLE